MSDHDRMSLVLADIAEKTSDATEETFLLFSQNLPHNDLGILDSTSVEIELRVAGHDYSVRQSPTLLKSTREAGTTGAVMWKVTPLLADWLASRHTILWTRGLLTKASNVLELGCGSAGLVGMALAPLVSTYILSDQDYVMKLVKENLAANVRPSKPAKKSRQSGRAQDASTAALKTLTFDWETDSVHNITEMLPADTSIDLVVLCDCIYNIYLIEPLVQTCRDICLMSPTRSTYLLIAQQLRTDAVFEHWLQTLMTHFEVWRLGDDYLPGTLNNASGYAIHLAMLFPES